MKDLFANYFDTWLKSVIDKQIDEKLKDSLFFVGQTDMENFVMKTVDKLFDSHMAAYTHHVKGETVFDVPGLAKELKALALEAANEAVTGHEQQFDHEDIHVDEFDQDKAIKTFKTLLNHTSVTLTY